MRMGASQRREQVLAVAEEEFAATGLHGTSAETIARRAGISQAYVFRIFGTKKQLFVEVVDGAFERMSVAMLAAAGGLSGIEALAAMGQEYDAMLADRTTLLLQLHGVALRATTRRCGTRCGPASAGCGTRWPTPPGSTRSP